LNALSNPLLRSFATISLCLALAGCLGGGNNSNPAPVEDRSTNSDTIPRTGNATQPQLDTPSTPPNQDAAGKNQVTLALLEKGKAARSQGNLKEAVTHVERAIRINPRRADLWVQLAQLQLELGKPTIAEGYARKAISLAGSRVDWQRDAWLVIADAKQAQGQSGEADAIRQRWRRAQG